MINVVFWRVYECYAATRALGVGASYGAREAFKHVVQEGGALRVQLCFRRTRSRPCQWSTICLG